MKAELRINNLPNKITYPYMVVRRCDDEDVVSLWYYGQYKELKQANEVAVEIGNGFVVETDARPLTNREKFKETFGFNIELDNDGCFAPWGVCDQFKDCGECPFYEFWDKEYKSCFKLKEEFDD